MKIANITNRRYFKGLPVVAMVIYCRPTNQTIYAGNLYLFEVSELPCLYRPAHYLGGSHGCPLIGQTLGTS
jgi:hypothetical protein